MQSTLYVRLDTGQFSIFNNHETEREKKQQRAKGCTHITWINWFLRENYRVSNSDCFTRRLPRWNLASFSLKHSWLVSGLRLLAVRKECKKKERGQEIETRNSFSSFTKKNRHKLQHCEQQRSCWGYIWVSIVMHECWLAIDGLLKHILARHCTTTRCVSFYSIEWERWLDQAGSPSVHSILAFMMIVIALCSHHAAACEREGGIFGHVRW